MFRGGGEVAAAIDRLALWDTKSGRVMSTTQCIYLKGIDCPELLAIGILAERQWIDRRNRASCCLRSFVVMVEHIVKM